MPGGTTFHFCHRRHRVRARRFQGLARGPVKLTQSLAVDTPGVTHIKFQVG